MSKTFFHAEQVIWYYKREQNDVHNYKWKNEFWVL